MTTIVNKIKFNLYVKYIIINKKESIGIKLE